jgi:hypothetical protein
MLDFLAGLITMGYLVGALFFLRFWSRTRDAFFALFSSAFALLAINQGLAALSGLAREEQSWIYLIRLVAFSLIVLAIVRKNVGVKT